MSSKSSTPVSGSYNIPGGGVKTIIASVSSYQTALRGGGSAAFSTLVDFRTLVTCPSQGPPRMVHG
jgi:hypothetical protein